LARGGGDGKAEAVIESDSYVQSVVEEAKARELLDTLAQIKAQ